METYPIKSTLIPGKVDGGLAERIKYKLSEEGEWFYLQIRHLQNGQRITNYYENEEFSRERKYPCGAELRKIIDSQSHVVKGNIIDDFLSEYELIHDNQVISIWEKAIILDNFFKDVKEGDERITRIINTIWQDEEDSDELPSLI